MTIAQLLEDLGLIKVTDSGKVEWDNNSLQNIMQIDVTQLLQERGIMQVADVATMQTISGQETNAIAIDQVGLFLFRDTGIPNYTTIFPATGGGVWVKQTGTVGGVVWGTITGTLSSQTDLQAALNTKVPTTRTVNGHALSADVTVTKGDIGLGNVENTALSTWAGSPNITTVGTIVTGDWHGNVVDILYGGTGHSTASGAINALLPVQTGQSGKYLTTNGSVASWNTVSGLTTIYTGDGTIATARTVTADDGGSVTGELRANITGSGDIQSLGIKDAGNNQVSGWITRPLLDPNDANSSPMASMSISDIVSATLRQSALYVDRNALALQQLIGTRFRQFVMTPLVNEAVYDDSAGYGIQYSTNINSLTFGNNTLVPKSYVDSVSGGVTLKGSATATGNGSTVITWTIPHGFGTVPTAVLAVAKGTASNGTNFGVNCNADITNITITTSVVGTNGVIYNIYYHADK